MFVDKYIQSLGSINLRDDEQHHQTDALAAAAFADRAGGSGEMMGSLLACAKYAEAIPHKNFFGTGNHNLATLLRAWELAVIRKGEDRKWLRIVHPWDVNALHGICRKIARHSLAHWLAGECTACSGTKVNAGRACARCAETPGREPVQGGALERERVREMISELEGLCQSHCARAGAKMRPATTSATSYARPDPRASSSNCATLHNSRLSPPALSAGGKSGGIVPTGGKHDAGARHLLWGAKAAPHPWRGDPSSISSP